MSEEIFGDAPAHQDTATVDDLVGEGKKYANINELAKAYSHADKRISELSSAVETERERAKVAIEIAEARNQKGPSEEGNNPPVPPAKNDKPEDFRSTIRDEVKALNEETKRSSNIAAAGEVMQSFYGDADKAADAVRRRASELGVSVEWLRDSAASSPAAFYATMGINQTHTSRSTPVPKSDYRPGNENQTKKWSYYNQLRRDNKTLYNSVDIQNEIKKAASEDDNFFDT